MLKIKEKKLRNGVLCLSRKASESITLFDRLDGSAQPIVITLHRIQGNKAKLHVNAPSHVAIVRTELMERNHGLANQPTVSDEAIGNPTGEGDGNETV